MNNSSLNNPAKNSIPDYDAIIGVPKLPYTAPADGFIGFYTSCANNGGWYCTLNKGTQSVGHVIGTGGNYNNQLGTIFPIGKGDVLSESVNVSVERLRVYFYPIKG